MEIMTYTDNQAVDRAVEILQNGGVVIYPTDTLYGMGCDFQNSQAISKVYNIKKISKRKPLSLLCKDLDQISQYAQLSNSAFRLLKKLLPGPYTFILPATHAVPKILMNNQRKVGIRVPDNPICLEIIERLGSPLLSTSAIYEGDTDDNDPQEIQKQYRDADLLIDSGILEYSQSSVIDISTIPPIVIRQGKGPIEQFIHLTN
ncbi:threonylcarbamoyl-AMP synthase [bacterium]|nr:threonylcarbamoyl-AMP synthase [bacterium]